MRAKQLILDLSHLPAYGREDFLVAESNAEAASIIDGFASWETSIKGLVGPEASGKSHLAAVWSLRADADIYTISDLEESKLVDMMDAPALVVDDLDLIQPPQEKILFHLFNHAQQSAKGLLLCARQPLASLDVSLADLKSRLSTVETARLEKPCESLMMAVLVKLFHDRQIHVTDKIIDYILPRMERSFAGLNHIVENIDKASLSTKKAVTIPLISRVLDEIDKNRNKNE